MRRTDNAVELVSRWLAARITRRSFLGRMGRLALMVAAGPSLAMLLAQRAEARVCGQSGVSPKCQTFDCVGEGHVWGWCWYASPGCCANGGLKKICDCCVYDWPNVHGYCPSGTNVKCIVESCWADPRVQAVTLDQIAHDDPTEVARALSMRRYAAGSQPVVRLVSTDALWSAPIAPLAAVEGVPLLLSDHDSLAPAAIAEIQRLGASTVRLIGSGGLDSGVRDELARYVTVTQDGNETSAGPASARAAVGVVAAGGGERLLCVAEDGLSADAAACVGAAASLLQFPVVVGADAAQGYHATYEPAVSYFVGPEAADVAGSFAGGHPLRSATRIGLAQELASVAIDVEELSAVDIAVVSTSASTAEAGLAVGGCLVLIHSDALLDASASVWVREHQPALTSAVEVGTVGTLGEAAVWELQAALNHYDVDQLVGVPGQGLTCDQPAACRARHRRRSCGRHARVARRRRLLD